ncbi:MAG TPA: ROK family protein [Segetibacter sp.]
MLVAKKPAPQIGFAMPGPFDYENGISLIKDMHKYEALYGMDIRQHICDELRLKPSNVSFRNDAEAFIAGEVFCGAAIGYKKAIGITLGTGVGSAKSCDGISNDLNLGSSLFKDGIAEDYISTRWFLKRYNELTGKVVEDVKQLAKLAETDTDVQQIFKEFTKNLSSFLKKFIDDESPAIVVIGGGMVGASALFIDSLRKALSKSVAQIKISELGEDASIIGAAALHSYAETTFL